MQEQVNIQVFPNSANQIRYARNRHYLKLADAKPTFSYWKLENLRDVEEYLEIEATLNQKQVGQEKNRSSNLSNSSTIQQLVAGPLDALNILSESSWL